MIKITPPTPPATCPRTLLESSTDISVLPLGVVKAGRLYRDGVDITTADIAAHCGRRRRDLLHQRRQPPRDYEALFRSLREKYDARSST